MRIIIDGIPPSINEFIGRNCRWQYNSAKEEWTTKVYAECMMNKGRKMHYPADVHLIYHFKKGARHDPDNYAGKFILDGLTKAGVIKDDRFGCIKLFIDGYNDGGNYTEIGVTDSVV